MTLKSETERTLICDDFNILISDNETSAFTTDFTYTLVDEPVLEDIENLSIVKSCEFENYDKWYKC